jgi:hypothetical protein
LDCEAVESQHCLALYVMADLHILSTIPLRSARDL